MQTHKSHLFVLFVSAFLALLLVMPALAQEPTAEPPVVIVDTGDAVDPVVIVRDASTALTELIAAFLAGGVIVGGGFLLVIRSIVAMFNSNPALTTAVERLYMSLPAETRERIRSGTVTGKELFDLLDDLTDEQLAEVQVAAQSVRKERSTGASPRRTPPSS